MREPAKILVVGGGYVGLYTALRLQKRLKLSQGEATITVVEPNSYMTYQPFLPEAAAGSLEPRHVVVPLRSVLRGCRVISGRVTKLSHEAHKATIEPLDGESFEFDYDHVVMAAGSIARTLPIPGLIDVGIGFKTIEEAVYLRNHILARLDAASSTLNAEDKNRALTFLFIGGGYAGIECIAELEDLARSAIKYYDNITAEDMRWVVVEATGRILPEVSEGLGVYTVKQLESRGIEVRLNTRVESLLDGEVILDEGTKFSADTIVWTAGVKANPVLGRTDFPLDEKGRLKAEADLRIMGLHDAWTAGDIAAVPDLSKPELAYCGPSAQHAVRQSKVLADNIVRQLRGQPLKNYKHAYAGSVASLGLYKGVAEIYGIKLRGFPAWFMHRTYHMSRVPTLNRKVRVIADWTLALFFPREITSLGQTEDPHKAFRSAADS